jgi:glycosyltransferase involved in cell wall biosynthesis
MRHSDLAACNMMSHLFVASSCHRDQIIQAGVQTPISVVSLPIDYADVDSIMPKVPKTNQIIFCSRMDREKRPLFMLEVAKLFLEDHKDYEWVCTTSAPAFKSYNAGTYLTAVTEFAHQEPRFKMLAGLSKADYYMELAKSKVQFNCSLQDYVSWTCLEACIAGCDLAYPAFRSFPECIPAARLYHVSSTLSALRTIERALAAPIQHHRLAHCSDNMRQGTIPYIVKQVSLRMSTSYEYNVWHDYDPNSL